MDWLPLNWFSSHERVCGGGKFVEGACQAVMDLRRIQGWE